MNTLTTGTTVQIIATRDVGKVRAVNGKTVTVWHPYTGVRTYHIDALKKLY